MKYITNYMVEKLVEILNIPSPSGDTEKAIAVCRDEFKRLGVKTEITPKGALKATLPGKKEESRIIAAHIDTLGGMVREITSNGFLKLTQIGGYSWNSVDGEYCTISTMNGEEIRGTILFEKSSVHNYGDAPKSDKRTEDNMVVRLDELVENAEDIKKLGINVGDFVYLDPRVEVTQSGFVKSRHLDNKAGVAIILGVCKYLMETEIVPEYTLEFFISNYEEVGHGAAGIATSLTQEILAIDMASPGIGQTSKENKVTICAKDSSGPYDLEMKKRLVNLCCEEEIDYVIDIYKYYGSDASALLRGGAQIKHALIGPGVDSSHSYERTHVDGLLNTAKLVIEYCK
ncbi:M42 family metallopeptidase [Psychrilyobacter atlanticus]|uniref:M42 family metallopeptidase n=1 Tax=Psychrilyobacter atlanticus TaxID=271091 RepID=UPI00040745D2|nr:M42 family metallopeptidase [Psychrilyobacter atlanticus]